MKRAIEILEPAEVTLLLNECDPSKPSGVRDRALLVVLYRAGLRISEALDLMPKDVSVKESTLRILHGKGDKARLVALDPRAMQELNTWRKLWPQYGRAESPVFCTLAGGKLDRRNVWEKIKALAAAAGIQKRVHPHGLRHVCFFQMINEGVPIHMIQQIAGHGNVSTTQIYISHLNPKRSLDLMKARSW